MGTLRDLQLALQDKLNELRQHNKLIDKLHNELEEKESVIRNLNNQLDEYRAVSLTPAVAAKNRDSSRNYSAFSSNRYKPYTEPPSCQL